MDKMDLQATLISVRDDGVAAFAAAADVDAVEEVRIAYLGRQGRLKECKNAFGAATPDEKRTCGKLLSEVDQALKAAREARLAALQADAADLPPLDVTLPGCCSSSWQHPCYQSGSGLG